MAMKNRNQMTVPAYLECKECGNLAQIQRRRASKREKNHIKHLYCYKCKDRTEHIEQTEDALLPAWLKEQQREEQEESLNERSR